MSKHQRPSYFFPMLILVLTLPTAASLLYVKITGDQTMRPLGITLANLAENLIDGTSRGIIVQVDWGDQARAASTQTQVIQALQKSLDVYQVEYRVKIRPTSGNKIQVFYMVGKSKIGPYRLQNLSAGIPAAMSAYRMAGRDSR